MGKVTGFLEIHRQKQPYRPIVERLHDWREVYLPYADADLQGQASRCMDCGIPFCHQGCPLGNLIPDWNDFVYRDRWEAASERLHATNNFPEWTGRLCPAPCEGSCVLGINDSPVTIKAVEAAIAERAFDEGWVVARPPAVRTGKRVAVVGSGPAGLAVADQLNRAGHWVTVFERADRVGGLLRYGIPEFKLEKKFLERRLTLMREEGVMFRTHSHVGVNVPLVELREGFEAIVLAGGSTAPRDLRVPGRELEGIYFAMEYLTLQNKRCEGDAIESDAFISAEARTSSSSAAAIRAPTASARCLVRARAACDSSSSFPARPTAARPGIPGRSGRTSSACHPRTRRAASGCTRCRPIGSAATAPVL
jgi:glutamate synthase (NADPH/NADH) small chain